MIKKFLLLVLFFIFSFPNLSFAVMANPNPIELKQPDGTKIIVKLKGDEFYSWFEDIDGYTIVRDPQTNYWSYAQKNSFGDLEPSQNIVGKSKPINLSIKKSLKDDNKLFEAKRVRAQYNSDLQKSLALFSKSVSSDSVKSSEKTQFASATGTKTNFVLLIQFKNLKFKDNPPFRNASDSDIIKGFDDLFNKENYTKDGAVGSVKDYFKEVSYGKLEYKSVISPIIITLEFDEDQKNYYEYYAYSNGSTISVLRTMEMITYALKKLDQRYDFKSLWPNSNTPDGFSVVHAGGGAEVGNHSFIWSHKSTLQTPLTLDGITFSNYHTEPAGRGYNGDEGLTRIGVVCHESLHFFGLPDLYDTSYLTGGLGNFCVMAGGEWNGDEGNRPCHPSAWCKSKLGLISCQTPVEDLLNTIDQSATESDAFYIFQPPNFDEREYFLMENRQSVGFDKDLPGSKRGILIYHVDERQEGNDLIYNDNYLVQLEEAYSSTSNWQNFPLIRSAGFGGSDSDYFRNSTISYFNDDCKSSPNSKSYAGVLSGIKISEISSSSSLMSFAYGKDVVIVDELSKVVCYPNPARKGVINIINLPTNVQDFSVEIFTLTSKLVRSYSTDDTEFTADGYRKVKWDCKNDAGEDVAPGVYLVLVKNASKKKVMKVAVIR